MTSRRGAGAGPGRRSLRVVAVDTPSLGSRAYLVTDGATAVVVDPPRDVDRVLDPLQRVGAELTHVVETHVHHDHVGGGRELNRRTGARHVLPAHSHVEFDHLAVFDDDELVCGGFGLRALRTPGHTPHHTSYALLDRGRTVRAVFTGGSLLNGATGRTDLEGALVADDLARAQHLSVRRLAEGLPATAVVFPGLGPGSRCAAGAPSWAITTLGRQAVENPALLQDAAQFAAGSRRTTEPVPGFCVDVAGLNRRGPGAFDLQGPVVPGTPAELHRRSAHGEWVVDLRSREEFAAAHVVGSLGFELAPDFATCLAWMHPRGTPLVLVGTSEEQLRAARRELVRLGLDHLPGAVWSARGSGTAGAEGRVRSLRLGDPTDLARARSRGTVHVLDVGEGEGDRGRVVAEPGARHVPWHALPARTEEVPRGEVWVVASAGRLGTYQAWVAASLLERAGRDVVLVVDRCTAEPATEHGEGTG